MSWAKRELGAASGAPAAGSNPRGLSQPAAGAWGPVGDGVWARPGVACQRTWRSPFMAFCAQPHLRTAAPSSNPAPSRDPGPPAPLTRLSLGTHLGMGYALDSPITRGVTVVIDWQELLISLLEICVFCGILSDGASVNSPHPKHRQVPTSAHTSRWFHGVPPWVTVVNDGQLAPIAFHPGVYLHNAPHCPHPEPRLRSFARDTPSMLLGTVEWD